MQPNLTTSDVERVIKRLRSVLSVRVNGNGDIEEIHVTIDESHNPKQVARDIESTLMSELGLRIDHRKISIAQIRGKETPAGVRLQLVNIAFSVDRQQAQAKVTLSHNQELFCGLASAPSHRYEQLQLVATAAVHAIEEYLYSAGSKDEARPSLALEEVTTVTPPGSTQQQGVLVIVRMVHARGEEALMGVAPVRQDVWRAAACATLDAINRRLAWFVE